MSMCNYISKHCKKETLSDLCNVIENGLIKQECSFSDVFLFLFSKHNNKKFHKTILNITNKCLNNENNNIKNYSYFQNNLLNSNIWAINYKYDNSNSNSNSNADEKTNEKHVHKQLQDKQQKQTLFDFISFDIKSRMIKQERLKLKQQLIEIQEKHEQQFDQYIFIMK